jgi:hypothetical protein
MPVLRREAREAGTVDLFGARERSVEIAIADDGRLPEWNVPDARYVRQKLSFDPHGTPEMQKDRRGGLSLTNTFFAENYQRFLLPPKSR